MDLILYLTIMSILAGIAVTLFGNIARHQDQKFALAVVIIVIIIITGAFLWGLSETSLPMPTVVPTSTLVVTVPATSGPTATFLPTDAPTALPTIEPTQAPTTTPLPTATPAPTDTPGPLPTILPAASLNCTDYELIQEEGTRHLTLSAAQIAIGDADRFHDVISQGRPPYTVFIIYGPIETDVTLWWGGWDICGLASEQVIQRKIDEKVEHVKLSHPTDYEIRGRRTIECRGQITNCEVIETYP